jgi:hypothetical protein
MFVMPMPVQIAGVVGDSASYIVTKKSMTDHAISQMVGKDCAVWYIVKDIRLCKNTVTR